MLRRVSSTTPSKQFSSTWKPHCSIRLQDSERPTASVLWFAVGNYMVFYVVYDDVMEVRRFAYGARDLTKIVV
jgi:hypothetical protein